MSFTDTSIATAVGALTQGKGLVGTVGVSLGGAYVGSQIKQEDPTISVIGAGAGAAAGYVGGKNIESKVKAALPGKGAEISGAVTGEVISGTVSDVMEQATERIRGLKDGDK